MDDRASRENEGSDFPRDMPSGAVGLAADRAGPLVKAAQLNLMEPRFRPQLFLQLVTSLHAQQFP